eukprot:364641-Chlamydomonas_euryale.AAC.4
MAAECVNVTTGQGSRSNGVDSKAGSPARWKVSGYRALVPPDAVLQVQLALHGAERVVALGWDQGCVQHQPVAGWQCEILCRCEPLCQWLSTLKTHAQVDAPPVCRESYNEFLSDYMQVCVPFRVGRFIPSVAHIFRKVGKPCGQPGIFQAAGITCVGSVPLQLLAEPRASPAACCVHSLASYLRHPQPLQLLAASTASPAACGVHSLSSCLQRPQPLQLLAASTASPAACGVHSLSSCLQHPQPLQLLAAFTASPAACRAEGGRMPKRCVCFLSSSWQREKKRLEQERPGAAADAFAADACRHSATARSCSCQKSTTRSRSATLPSSTLSGHWSSQSWRRLHQRCGCVDCTRGVGVVAARLDEV